MLAPPNVHSVLPCWSYGRTRSLAISVFLHTHCTVAPSVPSPPHRTSWCCIRWQCLASFYRNPQSQPHYVFTPVRLSGGGMNFPANLVDCAENEGFPGWEVIAQVTVIWWKLSLMTVLPLSRNGSMSLITTSSDSSPYLGDWCPRFGGTLQMFFDFKSQATRILDPNLVLFHCGVLQKKSSGSLMDKAVYQWWCVDQGGRIWCNWSQTIPTHQKLQQIERSLLTHCMCNCHQSGGAAWSLGSGFEV